jgi:hypothetical protein
LSATCRRMESVGIRSSPGKARRSDRRVSESVRPARVKIVGVAATTVAQPVSDGCGLISAMHLYPQGAEREAATILVNGPVAVVAPVPIRETST